MQPIPSRSSGAPDRLDLVAFTVILDDIVLPPSLAADFTVLPAQLGGSGPQTLYSYQLTAKGGPGRVGLAAGVGADLPASAQQWLAAAGISLEGLLLHPGMPTPRAWQVLEPDGRRHEIWRTPAGPTQAAMLLPPWDSLPPAFQAAKAYHVGINPSSPPLQLLHRLRASGALVSAETFTQAAGPLPAEQLLELLDVFSPNETEAASMLFERSEAETALAAAHARPWLLSEPFLAAAPLVVIRRGPRGAIVLWSAPAYPSTIVVDPTGTRTHLCVGLPPGAGGRGMADASHCCPLASTLACRMRQCPLWRLPSI